MFHSLELYSAYIYNSNDLLISFWATYLSFGPVIINDTIVTIALSLLSGAVVGFSLGLIGSGGSILAVPLLIYVVGVANTHVAIGTSALAVGANALINMIHHKKGGHVKVNEGALFAIPGAIGTIIGAQLGHLTSSEDLLILFAAFMILLSLIMLLRGKAGFNNDKKQEESHLAYTHIENSGRDETSADFRDRFKDIDSRESRNSGINERKHFLIYIFRNKK